MLDSSVKHSYSVSGASHVLAVSGLHVGILVLVFNSVVSLLLRGRAFRVRLCRSVVVVSLLWAYVWLVGGAPSVCRAALMFSFLCFSFVLQRPYSAYAALAASAFVILLVSPLSLFNVGFQLSYAAVFSIVFFYPRISRYVCFGALAGKSGFAGAFAWLLRQACGLVSVSLAAQIGTLPVVLFNFHQLSFSFWLSGLAVIPMVTVILYLSLAFFVFCWVPGLSSLIALAIALVVRAMNACVAFVASLPWAAADWVSFDRLDFLVSGLALASFSVFLVGRGARQLVAALCFSLLFLAKRLADVCVPQPFVVAVYNCPLSTVVNVFGGGSNVVFNAGQDSLRLERSLEGFWINCRAPKPEYTQSRVLLGGGRSVFVLDRHFSSFEFPRRVYVHYLVVAGDVCVPKALLADKLSYGTLIVDSSCSNVTAQWWKRNYPNVYVVREQGDFVERYL